MVVAGPGGEQGSWGRGSQKPERKMPEEQVGRCELHPRVRVHGQLLEEQSK